MSAIPQKIREHIKERDQGCCRRCGAPGQEIHHRQGRRSVDAHRPSNLVLLCRACHQWITEHPAEAYAEGWSVRRISNDNTATIPIRAWDGPIHLTDEPQENT